MEQISIVIPCYNEEKNIGKVIDRARKNNFSNPEIIVVDNNSQDKTSKISRNKGAIIVKEEKIGKGRAMRRGAMKARGEILVFIDGDNSYSAEFIGKIIDPLIKKESNIVYGSRFLKSSKIKISTLRLIGNNFFSFLGNLLYGKKADFLSGFFAIKKDNFFELNLKSNGFEVETEIFTKGANKDFNIGQVPIIYTANQTSRINPFIDGIKIFYTLFKNKLC